MGRSFCNQCGTPLTSNGDCTNVGCVAYVAPAVVPLAPPLPPPAAPDLLAGPVAAVAATAPGNGGGLPDQPVVLTPPAGDGDWVTAGDAAQNEVYFGNRLLFQPPEPTLNGSPELRLMLTALIRWLAIGLFVAPLILIVSIIFGLMSGPRTALVLFFLLSLGFWVLYFFLPARVAISEWTLLLDDKAAGAESAFAQISDAFRRREAPIAPTARRVSFRGLTGIGKFASNAPPVRNYLAVRYGFVVGYISAFPFGNDLYIGWTLWWRQRPIRSLWNLVRQLFASALGRDVQFQLTMRADDAKALRELMHSAAREGVDVATRELTISLAGTVGGNVPIESFEAAFEE